MTMKKLCTSVVFPCITRYSSTTQQTATTGATPRSFVVRFIEERRRKSEQDDIRLEPYLSKGVYTESGAIRPMPKRYPLGIIKVLFIAVPFLVLGTRVSKYTAEGLDKLEWCKKAGDDDDDD